MNPRLVLLAWQYRKELAAVLLAFFVGIVGLLAMLGGALAAVPMVGDEQIQLYQKAAEELTASDGTPIEGLSWQSLIAIDAVRYHQDFSRANEASIRALAAMFVKAVHDPGGQPCSEGTPHCTCKTKNGATVCKTAPRIGYELAPVEAVLAALPLTEEERRLIWTMGPVDPAAFLACLSFRPNPAAIFAWPVAGPLTSCFGRRLDPVTHLLGEHTGVDIAAAEGTPVYAAAAGTVVFAGESGTYGQAIHLQHDGTGVMATWYGHLSTFEVQEGSRVEKGGLLGRVGSTGKSTGPHLHFEWRVNGSPVNPLTLYR